MRLSGDPNTQLWAMADVFADKIEASVKNLTAEFGDRVQVDPARRFAGLDGYRGVIENSDIVLIACASRFHAPYGLAAVQAKKHVFVEKPAAVDVAGVHQLLEADELAKQNGTGVLAGLTYRYHLGRREAVERMHNGEIGEIVAIQCDYLRPPYGLVARAARLERNGVPVPQLVPLHLALGRRCAAVADPQSGLGPVGCPRRTAGARLRAGWTVVGVPDRDGHVVRPPFGDLRVCQRSQDLRVGAHGRGLFRQQHRRVPRDERPVHLRRLRPAEVHGSDRQSDVESRRGSFEEIAVPIRSTWSSCSRFARGVRSNAASNWRSRRSSTVLGQIAVYTGQPITWEEGLKSKFAFPPAGEVRMDMEPPVKPGPDGLYPIAKPGDTKLI